MKNKLLKYFIRPIILLSSFTFCLSPLLFGQPQLENIEKTEISGGAEYSIYLEKMINSGMGGMLKYNGTVPHDPLYKTDLISTIEGINFDQNASNNSGSYSIPPDPHGAAGPSHLVSVVNTSIEWFTKVGVQQNSQSLASFFASLTPLTGTFDPKVIYDQYNGRFVIVTLERTTTPSNTSRILVAVSKTTDPNGGWWFTSINSAITIGTLSWADYPGFAAGTNAIYITANMFSFAGNGYTGGRLWIINKTPFYTGGAASVNVYDHITLVGGFNITYQPTHMFGVPQSNTGTFLIGYSGLTTGVDEGLSIIRIDSPLGAISFNHQTPLVDNIDNTAGPYNLAPQLGTATRIATNDRRSQNAVWRNNFLWSAFTVVPNSGVTAGEVTAHWVRINTVTLSALALQDQGDVGGETIATNCYTFFPSIAVNSTNDIAIGFSASASAIYPGCYYTGRLSTDAAGFTIAPDVVRAGEDYYFRMFGGTRNRWGDYSGTSVDPSDDQTFYVFNEYALTRGTILPQYPTQDGRWGTAFGKVPVSALPVELTSFTAKVLRKDGVQLDWVTETEVNNYGFEVERKVSSEQLSASNWEVLGFIEGHGNSNSPKEYNFLDEGINYGNYDYRLKQIDNDGTFEFSDIIEVDAGNIPEGYVLEQNYPNPFNPSTVIKFALAESQQATLTVYDILGNEIAQLFNKTTEAGKVYEIEFNASALSSGVYYYRLSTPQKSLVRKMLLLQ